MPAVIIIRNIYDTFIFDIASLLIHSLEITRSIITWSIIITVTIYITWVDVYSGIIETDCFPIIAKPLLTLNCVISYYLLWSYYPWRDIKYRSAILIVLPNKIDSVSYHKKIMNILITILLNGLPICN